MVAGAGAATLAWVLVVYGTSLVLTSSALLAPLRRRIGSFHPKLEMFVGCMMCVGFWVGLALSWRYGVGVARFVGESRLMSSATRAILDGFASAGFCWILRVVMARLGEDEL